MEHQQFTALVQQYQAYIYTICYRFVLDAAAAEDLAQETFLAAYLHRDSCPAGSEKAWLARIAINKSKDLLKSGWSRRVQLAAGEEDNTLELTAAPDAWQPETTTLQNERQQAVRRAVCGLPPPYHDVAVLVFLQEKTPDEAASMTGRPPKTVYTQLARAKKLLARQLKEVAEP